MPAAVSSLVPGWKPSAAEAAVLACSDVVELCDVLSVIADPRRRQGRRYRFRVVVVGAGRGGHRRDRQLCWDGAMVR